MNATMTERFNVAGALLVKLFGRPDVEADSFSGRAGRVRDIGVRRRCTAGSSSSRSTPGRRAGAPRWSTALGGIAGVHRLAASPAPCVALALLLSRLYGPLTALSNVRVDVMSALVSASSGSSRCSTCEPLIAERPTRVPVPAGDRSIEFDDVLLPLPGGGRGVAGLAGVDVAAPTHTEPDRRAARRVLPRRARPAGRAGRTSGAGKSTITRPGPPAVRRHRRARSGSAGIDVRTLTLASLRDAIGVVSQDAHLFHDTIRANLLYARPEATEDELWAALDGGQIGDLVRALPDGLDTVVGDRGLPDLRRREAAAGDRPGAAQGAGHRDPRRGDRAPGQRVGGRRPARAGRRAPGAPRWSSRTGCPPSAAPTRSSWSTAAASSESGTHEELLALGGVTPTSTAPSL